MSSLELRSRLATPIGGFLAALALLVWGVQLAGRPLAHSDLWGHLAYGRYYDQQRSFPETDPFLQHPSPQPLVPNCWLSQWGGYRIRHAGGTVALQLSYSVLLCGFAGGVLWTLHRATRSWLLAGIGVVWFLWLEYQQTRVIRPQQTGMLCYALFLGLWYQRRRLSPQRVVGLLLVMLVWANLHGSFAMAPAVILLVTAGRILDQLGRRHRRGETVAISLLRVLREGQIKGNLLLALAFVVVPLINPFGWRLWREVVTFSSSPNLYALVEWKPLWETPKQGRVVLISVVAGLFTLAAIRQRPRWESWLPVIVVGIMMVRTSRFIVWWAPLFLLAVVPYWNLWRVRGFGSIPFRRIDQVLTLNIPAGKVILLVAVCASMSLTPWGTACFLDGEWTPSESYSSRTPLAATQALQELDPQGPLFNTMEWGDWIIWAADGSIPVFTYTHVPNVSEEVWQDYLAFVHQEPGWRDRWEDYRFSTAVIFYRKQDELAESLKQDPAWREAYRDRRAVIFARVE